MYFLHFLVNVMVFWVNVLGNCVLMMWIVCGGLSVIDVYVYCVWVFCYMCRNVGGRCIIVEGQVSELLYRVVMLDKIQVCLRALLCNVHVCICVLCQSWWYGVCFVGCHVLFIVFLVRGIVFDNVMWQFTETSVYSTAVLN